MLPETPPSAEREPGTERALETPESPADEGWQPAPAGSPALEPLKEPWWLVALDAVRSDRRLQIGAGAAFCLVMLGFWFLPRGIGTTPLSQVRRHPAQYDGLSVTVRGRVGHDVFPVGGGWAFYLVQGRDTIVAYTRTARPEPHTAITLKGQVSTGFLDGQPRQALFEDGSGTD
jgi:hypothetical protein